jgi:hypothetical protein
VSVVIGIPLLLNVDFQTVSKPRRGDVNWTNVLVFPVLDEIPQQQGLGWRPSRGSVLVRREQPATVMKCDSLRCVQYVGGALTFHDRVVILSLQ